MQSVKDGIQNRVYKINKESATSFNRFIAAKVKTYVRKSQVQFREKLRKLRIRQNDGYLLKEKRAND